MNALRAVHRLLADDGVMMLTTPNVEGALPRLTISCWHVRSVSGIILVRRGTSSSSAEDAGSGTGARGLRDAGHGH